MITIPEFLKLEVDFRFYSVTTRVFCPYCVHDSRHKPRTYHSLKSLGHHVAAEHKDSNLPSTSKEKINEILKVLAKALEIGILPYEKDTLKKRTLFFPKIERCLK